VPPLLGKAIGLAIRASADEVRTGVEQKKF